MANNNQIHFVNVTGRYTLSGDLELAANIQNLHILSDALNSDRESQSLKLSVPELVPPSPYDGFLDSMLILHTDSFVNIQRNQSAISIIGEKKYLAVMADNIKFLATNACGSNSHIHIEYFPESSYLHSLSLSLIISVEL